MRDIKGNNYGVVIDKSQTTIINGERVYKDSGVEKEEISLEKIVKEKVVEAIIGVIFTGVATIISKFFNSLDSYMKLALLVIMITLFIFGIEILVAFLFDMRKLLKLAHKGDFVELISKRELLTSFFEGFFNPNDNSYKNTRTTGKCYKSVKGKIYKIKGKKCPLCETEPIGNMCLKYSNCSNKYFWECTQNQAHRIEFDYKKKI